MKYQYEFHAANLTQLANVMAGAALQITGNAPEGGPLPAISVINLGPMGYDLVVILREATDITADDHRRLSDLEAAYFTGRR